MQEKDRMTKVRVQRETVMNEYPAYLLMSKIHTADEEEEEEEEFSPPLLCLLRLRGSAGSPSPGPGLSCPESPIPDPLSLPSDPKCCWHSKKCCCGVRLGLGNVKHILPDAPLQNQGI